MHLQCCINSEVKHVSLLICLCYALNIITDTLRKDNYVISNFLLRFKLLKFFTRELNNLLF